MLLQCYSLCFLFAICATVPLSESDGPFKSDSHEEPSNSHETKSPDRPQNTALMKVRATIRPNKIDDQLMKTKDGVDTESGDLSESQGNEEEGDPKQPTSNENKPDSDGNIKNEYSTIDLSKNSADKFIHIANMTDLAGFNYSPTELTKFKVWAHGVVPFFIDGDLSFDKIIRDKIREYLDSTNSLTGLRFMEIPKPPDDEETRWVLFLNRRGQLNCTDYNFNSFTETGVQKVILGYDCLEGGREMAAIVLAIAGVPPQHNSPDRDSYIEVSMKSVLPDKTSFFQIVPENLWIFYDIQYDFLSAGHYPSHKYTVDGSATITARNKQDEPVGESDGFSISDIKKIRMLYNYIVSENNKELKRPDCQTLFRPGSKIKSNKFKKLEKNARKKPLKYVEATKKVGESILDGKDTKEEDKKPSDPKITDENNENNKIDKQPDLENGASEHVKKEDSKKTQEGTEGDKEEEYSEYEDSNSVDANNPRQKLKKKKRYAGVDPLKWDDIRTDESD